MGGWVDRGRLRLGQGSDANAILGWVCGRVWSWASGELVEADTDSVVVLAVWEGRLMSGHGSGKLRV